MLTYADTYVQPKLFVTQQPRSNVCASWQQSMQDEKTNEGGWGGNVTAPPPGCGSAAQVFDLLALVVKKYIY
jgi:hypothetical protein